ncbi:MAG: hypothetical protein ACOCZW_00555, partial [Bacteroidota bacterium]
MRIVLTLFLLAISSSMAQTDEEGGTSDNKFYFDAIIFYATGEEKAQSGDKEVSGRADVYALVPYETLDFIQTDDGNYGAKYKLIFSFNDSTGKRVKVEQIERIIKTDSYYSAQGGKGEYDYAQSRIHLPEGSYQLNVLLIDEISKEEYERSRKLKVIDFTDFNFSISGIMLVSEIEQKNSRYIITPHISDNIQPLADGFFIFFESYNFTDVDSADFSYEIYEADNIIAEGKKQTYDISEPVNRHYMRILPDTWIKAGRYNLRVNAYPKESPEDGAPDRVIAAAERSIKFRKTLMAGVTENLDKAIDQLEY